MPGRDFVVHMLLTGFEFVSFLVVENLVTLLSKQIQLMREQRTTLIVQLHTSIK